MPNKKCLTGYEFKYIKKHFKEVIIIKIIIVEIKDIRFTKC